MISNAFIPKLFSLLREGYSFKTFKSDALAGLTVAIVALPLAMALAIASGVSPDKGLTTAVIAGFMISFLGGSRVQIGGPTGAFVVVIYTVIAHHGYDGLIMATLLAGLFMIIAGYTKLGQLIKFIPYPVIVGFTAGIAVIIASSQVKDFFGLTIAQPPVDFIHKWQSYFEALNTTCPTAIIIGVLALAIILLLRHYAPKWPGYLIAIGICAVIVAAFHLPIETIGSRFPNLLSGLQLPRLPIWSFTKFQHIVPSAFTIAFLASIESLLSAVVADGMTGFKHRSNQELIGNGVANIASALFGGLPATGAIARTATNIKSGGKTPIAGIFHAIFILLFMLFAMKIIAFVPMAALAAILFIVAWGMSEIHHFIHILRLSSSDRFVMFLTFGLTVFVNLTVAIGVGVTLTSLLFMRHMSRTVKIHTQGRSSIDIYDIKYEEENQRLDLPPGVEVFQITGPVFFGVAGDLLEALKLMGQMPRVLILRMRLVPYLDTSGEIVIKNIVKQCRDSNTTVILSAVQKQPAKVLLKGGTKDGKDGVLFSPDYSSAINTAEKIKGVKS
ncbi:MAG: STAS domain-containing protein [Gammaproteobacteria bacterium]|nr:STAS domain-containing protein [Gammaproteobacteria bacterium]